MSRASAPTLLSLSRYARIVGLDPLHFAQGFSELRPESVCSDIWFQYDWQGGDKVSREYLAGLIATAEFDIAKPDALGYWPAEVWIEDEIHSYPRTNRPEAFGTGADLRGGYKSLGLNWGYVIEGGKRETDEIAISPYTELDADGDGYEEWAVFVINGVDVTLDPCEIRAYFKEYDATENCRTDPNSSGADPAWRVRPIRASLSGTTLTIRIPRWELFKPQLQQAFNAEVIDADAAASYVDELAFYRVYTNPEDQVQFRWSEYCLEEACVWAAQAGCFKIKNPRRSRVILQPATYSDDSFTEATWTTGYEPDTVQISYRAGYTPQRPTTSCEPLSDFWAETIAILVTARLDRPLCECTNVRIRVDKWREDLSRINEQRSFSINADVLSNPFGTRAGEVQAWKRVKEWRKSKGIRI